ncbi:uncharacterized protein LOC133519856 [Cydia pomonella]|uniref:uncharacterized protein LOC133519856 n=1 Tax=Cydia pomonella TaxID=82600 RepID=UPI002ADE8AA9|nr:uncharacterized protein LOC133519856 [Cydia pomonella]
MSRISGRHFVPWPARARMFRTRTRTLIFAVVSIASTATFALAEPIITNPALPTTLSTPTTPTVPAVLLSSCQKLDHFIEIYDLDSRGFVQTLKLCNEEPINSNTTTEGTSVLLKLYNEIKGEQCTFKDGMDQKLIECVNKVLGFKPQLTADDAKNHFGRNGTRALRFEDQECINSVKVRECVETILSEKHMAPEFLGCKKSIIRGFNITANICQLKAKVRGARGSGMKSLPSDILILGTAVMLIKLTLSLI